MPNGYLFPGTGKSRVGQCPILTNRIRVILPPRRDEIRFEHCFVRERSGRAYDCSRTG